MAEASDKNSHENEKKNRDYVEARRLNSGYDTYRGAHGMMERQRLPVLVSSMGHRRIARARAWLEARAPAEEVLIIGASRDAANELARQVAQMRGAAFGGHRLTLTQLAAALGMPVQMNRDASRFSRWRISFFGKPASTFPGYALGRTGATV